MPSLRALPVLPFLLALCLLPLAAAAQPLTVSAAASLSDAFREIGARFESGRAGVTLRLNFAASGVLVQQIIHGAPVDVFASADPEAMDRGVAARVIESATRRDFAGNALVLVAPLHAAPAPAPGPSGRAQAPVVPLVALADLAGPGVRRIALGKPLTVAAGRYARQALEAAGLWQPLQPRLVFADNVRQVLDYVARGEADAGFVFRTDAALMPSKVRVVLTAGGHAPVRYPAAVVAGSRQAALAREFVDFLATPAARDTLARHGFTPP